MRGDFHIHTIYSDGALSVEEVLKEASKSLDIISITDHDGLTGAKKAIEIADKYSIKVILGVEFSTEYLGESVHILGYFKNDSDLKELEEVLEKQRINRIKRCQDIAELLKRYFKIELDVTPLLRLHSITRGNIASEIISQGYDYTKKEIFERMLGDNCPAYIPSTKITTPEAIEILKRAKATIVLAHPVLLKKNSYKELIAMGLDGLEAIYPANLSTDTKRFKYYAKQKGLVFTAGSDFHDFDDYKHGNIGSIYLSGEELDLFIKKVME